MGNFLGGGAKGEQNIVRGYRDEAASQAGTSSQRGGLLFNEAQSDRLRGEALQQPAIDFYSKLMSGDPNALAQVAAPALANISSQYQQGRESIWDMPAGAGRGVALGQLERGKASAAASALTQPYLQAPGALYDIGTGLQQQSLQTGGLGLGYGQLGTQQLGQASQLGQWAYDVGQGRQATAVNAIGQLIGLGSSILTGGIPGLWGGFGQKSTGIGLGTGPSSTTLDPGGYWGTGGGYGTPVTLPGGIWGQG